MVLSSTPPSPSAVTAEPPYCLLSTSPLLSKGQMFQMHRERLCRRCLALCWRVKDADHADRLQDKLPHSDIHICEGAPKVLGPMSELCQVCNSSQIDLVCLSNIPKAR